jgi:hypothetical protein
MPPPSAYNVTIREYKDDLLELYEKLDRKDRRINELQKTKQQQQKKEKSLHVARTLFVEEVGN